MIKQETIVGKNKHLPQGMFGIAINIGMTYFRIKLFK